MASDSPGIRRVGQEVFASWMAVLAGHFTRHVGANAARLAEHTVMCLEGALLLGRMQRSTAPAAPGTGPAVRGTGAGGAAAR
jgi:transcriptional regulator LmrA/YxaF-like protein